MNYLSELRSFKDWCLMNQPSTGQIALWHALMLMANSSGWQEWFLVPSQTLELLTGLSHSGVNKARQTLIDRGLIEYRPSDNRKKASRYKVNSLCKLLERRVNELENELGHELENELENELEPQQRTSEGMLYKLNKTKTKRKQNNNKPPISPFANYTQNPVLLQRLEEFVEMRQSIKKPMTDRAKKELLAKLDKLASTDEEKISILDQSIFNSWQGVFALKQDNRIISRGRSDDDIDWGYGYKPEA